MSTRLSRRSFLAAALSAAGVLAAGCGVPPEPSADSGALGPAAPTVAVTATPQAPAQPAAGELSRIALENQLSGTDDWQLERSAAPIPFGLYLDHNSVAAGQRLQVFASAKVAASCRLEVFRLGYYGGAGARRVLVQDGVQVPAQGWWTPADGLHDARSVTYDAATGLVDCHWAPVTSIETGPDWVSGYYAVRLTDLSGAHASGMFVLRDDIRPGKLIALIPTFTHQAYNVWGGKSLYDYNTTNIAFIFGHTHAVKVSFNRPCDRAYGLKQEILDDDEPQFVRWAERQGYDLSYCTDADLHRRPQLLRHSLGLIVVGHAEYWTSAMFDHALAAREAGKHLAFLGGNDVYWQIRAEADAAGHSDRTVVCYKSAADDPLRADPEAVTAQFVDPAIGRPQSILTGTVYGSELWPLVQDWVVARDHWLLDGTQLRPGDRIKNLVGREYDRLGPALASPPEIEVIGASPVADAHGGHGIANTTLYRAPSGALVFSAGTVYWPCALSQASPNYDPRVGQMTANLLNHFLYAADSPLDH